MRFEWKRAAAGYLISIYLFLFLSFLLCLFSRKCHVRFMFFFPLIPFLISYFVLSLLSPSVALQSTVLNQLNELTCAAYSPLHSPTQPTHPIPISISISNSIHQPFEKQLKLKKCFQFLNWIESNDRIPFRPRNQDKFPVNSS